jgi:hypothetical protein
MEIKSVKLVDDVVKTTEEKERELLQEHQEQIQEEVVETKVEDQPIIEEQPKLELTEDIVLSYIKEKKNIKVNSLDDFDELLNRKPVELDEEIQAYQKYKQETGRPIEDFLKLQKDYTKEDPNTLLKEFYRSQDPELTERELEYKVKRFRTDDLDEDLDADEITEKTLAQREELAKATKFFEHQKEQYKLPLESSRSFVPEAERETYESYKQYLESLPQVEQEAYKKAQYFTEQTEKLFSDKFEGFKFKAEDKELTYKPAEATALRESQSDVNKFFGRFVDEKGFVKDAEAFHKALAIAADPDKFFRFAYEQGKADGVSALEKDAKNLDLGTRSATTVTPKEGIKARILDDGTDSRYVIKSNKQR